MVKIKTISLVYEIHIEGETEPLILKMHTFPGDPAQDYASREDIATSIDEWHEKDINRRIRNQAVILVQNAAQKMLGI